MIKLSRMITVYILPKSILLPRLVTTGTLFKSNRSRLLINLNCYVNTDARTPKMENIENVKVGPMPESQFLKPFRMEFTQVMKN